MGKLYLFAIGGTGSRVLRAFTMLCASGMKVPNCTEVIPLIIDPDTQNGDMLNRCVAAMTNYRDLRSKLGNIDKGYYATKISSLRDIQVADPQDNQSLINDSFIFELKNLIDHEFCTNIEYYQLDPANKHLIDLLYTRKNLDDRLTKGFLGNPNVGSVVLNQLRYSQTFSHFSNSFSDGDRIFIISSIFGGTGAAGFPLILKTMRQGSYGTGSAAIKSSKIGAVTVMPYYKVQEDEDSAIDSGNFITKTKAALTYYKKNINDLDALYYIGDKQKGIYKNCDGGSGQKNNAHLVEMVAATAIFDFMGRDESRLGNKFFEFAMPLENEDADALSFDNLPISIKNMIAPNLSNYFLMSHFLKSVFPSNMHQPFVKTLRLEDGFINSLEQEKLSGATSSFLGWIQELETNSRSFKVLNAPEGSDLSGLINGKPFKSGLFSKFNFEGLLKELNSNAGDHRHKSPFQNLLNLTHKSIESLLKSKIPNL